MNFCEDAGIERESIQASWYHHTTDHKLKTRSKMHGKHPRVLAIHSQVPKEIGWELISLASQTLLPVTTLVIGSGQSCQVFVAQIVILRSVQSRFVATLICMYTRVKTWGWRGGTSFMS